LKAELISLNDSLTKVSNLATEFGEPFVESLLGVFRESLANADQDLKNSFHTQNLEGIRKVVHKLRSSAANLGALQLEMLCFAMEHVKNFQEAEKIQPLILQEIQLLSARVAA